MVKTLQYNRFWLCSVHFAGIAWPLSGPHRSGRGGPAMIAPQTGAHLSAEGAKGDVFGAASLTPFGRVGGAQLGACAGRLRPGRRVRHQRTLVLAVIRLRRP